MIFVYLWYETCTLCKLIFLPQHIRRRNATYTFTTLVSAYTHLFIQHIRKQTHYMVGSCEIECVCWLRCVRSEIWCVFATVTVDAIDIVVVVTFGIHLYRRQCSAFRIKLFSVVSLLVWIWCLLPKYRIAHQIKFYFCLFIFCFPCSLFAGTSLRWLR